MVAIVSVFFAALASSVAPHADSTFTAHEWGTFTSVIDADGTPLDWYRPHLTEPLPAFVHRREFLKQRCDFPVRMETPVIYFHTDVPLRVDVVVEFPSGLITETYPYGTTERDDSTERVVTTWRSLLVDPGLAPIFPRELSGDHYYAARAVSAAPLELDRGEHGVERERFVFYRGVADFEIPLRVTLEGDRLRIANEGDAEFCGAFVFERAGARCSLRPIGDLRPGAVVYAKRGVPAEETRVDLLPLENELVARGLFRDEAAAMIETWRSSWFEEGLRVLYLLPRAKIDALLPLTITPAARLERVFVGRHELVTPELRAEIVAFGRRLEAGRVDRTERDAARARFGRVGYGVLMREALAFETVDPARCWKLRADASRFSAGE
jgi:hypothetical protein